MCTASWWYAADGTYEVFFNRDEQTSRAAALLPKIYRRDGIRYIAPLDGARGGTWFASNDQGVTVSLVNHYPALPPAGAAQLGTTRGELVLRCASATDAGDVLRIIEAEELGSYRPFHLLALALDGDAKLLSWDGRVLEHSIAGLESPLTSSSYQTAAVIEARRRRYALLARSTVRGGRPPLEIFHDQHDPHASAHSVLMKRPDAATVSQIRARVGRTSLQLEYRTVDWTLPRTRWGTVRTQLALRSAALALAS
jgi:hypothetical protein